MGGRCGKKVDKRVIPMPPTTKFMKGEVELVGFSDKYHTDIRDMVRDRIELERSLLKLKRGNFTSHSPKGI